MDIIRYDYDKVNKEKGTAVAIGNFDGLHRGHMEIMKTLKKVSNEYGIEALCYTFENHPVNILSHDKKLKLIADNGHKEKLFAVCGIGTLFFEDFSKVKDIPAKDFIKDILVDKLNMKVVVVGLHNHYGKNSEGDIKLLRELGQEYGFAVYMTKPYYVQDEMCSSSKIRQYISAGEIKKANEMLGRPFAMMGNVVRNKELGRKLGFPTANIMPKEDMLLPKEGVYATNCIVDGISYKSITNVGACPTVKDEKAAFETHIIDFDQDIYGKDIIVEFCFKMRDIICFESVDGLKEQLKTDVLKRKEAN